MQFDIWNTGQEKAERIYEQLNYEIVENNSNTENICIIYCSSNNIWFPNTIDAFERSFVKNDYYEWKNFSHIRAKKVIFIRDIYKSWYVTGINSKLNTIDKVIEFLKFETKNMDIITVGSSAGGYAAALLGAKLNAKYVLCFSAQFDLNSNGCLDVNPFLQKYAKDNNISKYYQIKDVIAHSCTEVYYIMPYKAKIDYIQMEKVKGLSNVHILKVNSKHHGVPVLKCCLEKLLWLTEPDLRKIFDEYRDDIVSPLGFSVRLSGIKESLRCVLKEITRSLKRKIRR